MTGIVFCCARTANGHATAAPPARKIMKSRRLMPSARPLALTASRDYGSNGRPRIGWVEGSFPPTAAVIEPIADRPPSTLSSHQRGFANGAVVGEPHCRCFKPLRRGQERGQVHHAARAEAP